MLFSRAPLFTMAIIGKLLEGPGGASKMDSQYTDRQYTDYRAQRAYGQPGYRVPA